MGGAGGQGAVTWVTPSRSRASRAGRRAGRVSCPETDMKQPRRSRTPRGVSCSRMIRARRALSASGRPAWAWALGALGGVAAGAASCTLIATFDDRPSPTTTTATTTTDSTGGGGAGGAPLGIVGAFPLERCEGTPAASPFADGECNYRDEACTGFADLAHEYVAKGTLVASEPALACDRGALAAYGRSTRTATARASCASSLAQGRPAPAQKPPRRRACSRSCASTRAP